jgi:hypothetical protein
LQWHGESSVWEVRFALGERLRERLPELRSAVATRVYAISDPRAVADPAYLEGLNEAVDAAVEYRLAVLEAGERQAPAVPVALFAQARLDARDKVPVDTVLRRYFAGNTLFGDFLVKEAERAEVPNPSLRHLLAEQATLGDRLLAAISAEYTREANSRPASAAERRRECVKSLLAGELVDTSELGYDLDAHHLGLMAKGEGAEELVRELASRLDRRLLAVRREEEPVWACWLGGIRPLDAERALTALADLTPDGVLVTVGEADEGLPGWRFSHQQAKAALPIAERKGESVRYVDVAILAAVIRDDLAVTSLREIYLKPLKRARDGGKVARETLRAYFQAERNISSTAARLGVDRRTVRNRLGAIEELIAHPLKDSLLNLEVALQLDAIGLG